MCPLIFEGPWDKKLHIDHDHATKRVRGLLCATCNLKLGFIEDTELVTRAMAYLKCSSTINDEVKVS